jgi:hypothetical protein
MKTKKSLLICLGGCLLFNFILILLLHEEPPSKPLDYCGRTLEEEYQKDTGSFLNYNLVPKKFKPAKNLTKKVPFVFHNNPYHLDSRYKIRIALVPNFSEEERYIVYEGVFQKRFFGYFPEIKEGTLVEFFITIYSPYAKDYAFWPLMAETYNISRWYENYDEIAIVFLPDRKEIHFYPCF